MNEKFASVRIIQLERQAAITEDKMATVMKVLKEIVGKELLRSQAVQVALIKKNMLTDAEIVAALNEIIEGAKTELKAEATKVEEQKAKAVEILVPSTMPSTPTEKE